MKMKKAFACLLAVLLIFGIMPTGVFADETSDGETTDEPHYKVAVQLTKSETDFTTGNPYYSLEDAVYAIYKDVDDPDNYPYWEHEPCATTQATDENGYCEVPGGLPSGNYVAIMSTRAKGYRYDQNHHVFEIANDDVLVNSTVKPSSITMNIYKNDRDYGAAAGDATLGGAVYRVYYPQGTGETYSDITTDETGFAMVENMPFGRIRAQEITAPTGYKLDPIVHTYNITVGGSEEPFVFDNFSLRDEVIKGQIAIKTQSDIALLSLDTLDAQDRKFEVYLASAGSYDDAKETERDIVTADENGTALTKLLPYGTYTVREIGEDGEVLSEGFNASIIEDKKTYVYTSDGEPEEKPESTATPAPTEEPTATPEPSATPTATAVPTATPTAAPTAVPTATPTAVPTAAPTAVPTATPTAAPTATPTPASSMPKTGSDNTVVYAAIMILMISAAAMSVIIYRKHRNVK